MTPLASLLFAVAGAVLGALGGGGSILATPILVGVVGLAPRAAIASSLVIVGLTAVVGVLRHQLAGNVRWRVGLALGAASMVGGYAGGRLAGYLPERLLLALFAGLMFAAGARMARPPGAARDETVRARVQGVSPAAAAVAGVAIGVVTGLLGAGGGFLIVPVLVLGLGLPMNAAVGTSLVVIAMNSAAGLAGHLGHTAPDLPLAGAAAAASAAGVLVGVGLAARVSPLTLRRAFGALVIAVAAWTGAAALPAAGTAGPDPWPAPLAGLAIGLFVLAFARFDGRRLGVSSGYYDACRALTEPAKRGSWRLTFLAGIVAGGWVAARVAGAPPAGFGVPLLDEVTGWSLGTKAAVFVSGGACLGFGARLAGGCTSGHAIVGCAQLRPHSAKVAVLFMTAAAVTTRVVLQALGTSGRAL